MALFYSVTVERGHYISFRELYLKNRKRYVVLVTTLMFFVPRDF